MQHKVKIKSVFPSSRQAETQTLCIATVGVPLDIEIDLLAYKVSSNALLKSKANAPQLLEYSTFCQ